MAIPIIYLLFSFLITKLLIPPFLNMLYENECVRDNYKEEKIPVCMGLIFIPIIIFIVISIFVLKYEKNPIFSLVFLVGTMAMGFAGLLDDLLGDRRVTGLKGHFKMMLKGNLTTGGFKALLGGVIAFTLSLIISHQWVDVFINTFIIALFTNFINLLDLRPGRAIKGFILSAIILLLNPIAKIFQFLLLGLVGAALAYLPYDLKAKSMLGDVGSNILGISLGIVCGSIGFYPRIIVLILLILIHIYTEKYSLTKTIENTRILNYIDKMGRS